jgi:hypothetical protein
VNGLRPVPGSKEKRIGAFFRGSTIVYHNGL